MEFLGITDTEQPGELGSGVGAGGTLLGERLTGPGDRLQEIRFDLESVLFPLSAEPLDKALAVDDGFTAAIFLALCILRLWLK